MRTVNRANHDFALAGLGLGIAVLVVVWVFANRGVRARRLMTSDLDIYRSANELIKQYGEAADIEAAMRPTSALLPVTWRGKPCGSGRKSVV